MLKIAIQNNGRLSDGSIAFLKSLGLKFDPNGRNLITWCKNFDLCILYVRNSDIPEYVERGVADFGIVGENVLCEKLSSLNIVKKLGFGICRLVIAAPKDSSVETVYDLNGRRIATSYPESLSVFLRKYGVNSVIVRLNGSVEIAPGLNIADAVCDITQTGRTLAENNLKPVIEILKSQAVLVESPFKTDEKNIFLNLINYETVKC